MRMTLTVVADARKQMHTRGDISNDTVPQVYT